MSPRREPSGHRSLPHTADARVEAWATSREECVREAVLGSVELFCDSGAARPTGSHEFHVADDDDEQLLLAVLGEVVFLLDTTGAVPVRVAVTPVADGTEVRFETVGARTLPQVGAAPKAVSLHGLRFGRTGDGWRCLVTWDV